MPTTFLILLILVALVPIIVIWGVGLITSSLFRKRKVDSCKKLSFSLMSLIIAIVSFLISIVLYNCIIAEMIGCGSNFSDVYQYHINKDFGVREGQIYDIHSDESILFIDSLYIDKDAVIASSVDYNSKLTYLYHFEYIDDQRVCQKIDSGYNSSEVWNRYIQTNNTKRDEVLNVLDIADIRYGWNLVISALLAIATTILILRCLKKIA